MILTWQQAACAIVLLYDYMLTIGVEVCSTLVQEVT